MKITARAMGLIGLLGGAGGAINALLCYLKFPVDTGPHVPFPWHIIPAGGAHGALLAAIAAGCASAVWNQRAWMRWAAAPVVGWLSGWLSWIPLQLCLHPEVGINKAPLWPFVGNNFKETAWGLWQYFGLVGMLCFVGLQLLRRASPARRRPFLAVGIISGCLGSLWWWIEMKPWYFSLIHGTIWGSLVGYGVWKSQRAAKL